MPKNSRQLPSFTSELNIKITLLVAIPMLVSVVYWSYSAYKQALELAFEDVQRHASSLALEIKTSISAQQSNFSHLSSNKVLGEASINLLFSQYTFHQLKSLVSYSPAIDGAFIVDGSDFIIDGYPLDTLKINDQTVKNFALQLIARPYTNTETELFFLAKTDEHSLAGDLYVVVPLRRQLASLIKPFENTAALFLRLAPNYLLKNAHYAPETHISLLLNQSPYYDVGPRSDSKNLSVHEVIVKRENQGGELSLKVSRPLAYYTEKVWTATTVTLIALLLMFTLVLGFLRRFSIRFNRPLELLAYQSKQFITGNYQTSDADVEFVELETFKQTLNTMAETIALQMQSLELERNKAKSSEQMKARFLANMSHEIRTPLNGVMGLLKMIESEPLSENQRSWLINATHSANLLLTVVNDILDLSKIEEGKVELEIIPYNFQLIIANTESTATMLIKDKAKDIRFVVENNLVNLWWYCDPTRLTQIIINLVSNAIKFTQQGQVTMTLDQQTIKGDCMLYISISDTGIGIAEENIAKIFRSFEQGDLSTTREFGGTGLGLAISKHLANLMKGDIKVTSVLKKGSVFLLTIPLNKAPPQEDEQKLLGKIPELSNFHILVVEDNKINQTILAHVLNQTNARLSFAENGELAVQQVITDTPDIILMDVQMPVMDGVQAMKKIRALGYQQPIVMQTANVLEDEIARYIALGANAHIAKPVDVHCLFSVLSQQLLGS